MLRFNPVPWLRIVTTDAGDNGAAWVGDGAGNGRKLGLRPSQRLKSSIANAAKLRAGGLPRGDGLIQPAVTWARRMINSISLFFIAPDAASSSVPRDPLVDVWIAIRQRNASRSALSKKSHSILTGQSQFLEINNDATTFPFGGDERLQLGNVRFVDPTA